MCFQHNSAEEMRDVITDFIEGRDIDFKCIAPEGETSGLGDTHREWGRMRLDIMAHHAFDFKNYAYRTV